jgi:predicted phosphodiesterase
VQVFKFDFDTSYDEMKLYVISDVHIEDALHNRAKFSQYIDEINACESAKVILNGDIINNAILGSKSDIYSAKSNPDNAIDTAYKLLYPIKDKIIVMSPGNHENRTYKSTGIDLTKELAIRLFGVKDFAEHYTPGAYLIFLSFGRNNGRDSRKTVYTIYGKHGLKGGKTVGAKANAVAEMELTVDADIYIHSHVHIPMGFHQDFVRCDYRNRKITHTTHTFVISNAFLDPGGYGEELGFRPSTIKVPKIVLKGHERDVEVRL